MKLIRGINHIQPLLSGCVLTIGNFDGVHLGHCHVLQKLIETAKGLSLPSVVMIFEPQPLEFFRQDKAPARLTNFREKYHHIKALGIDHLLCVKFSQSIANLDPQEFIEKILVRLLGVRYLVVGDDFRFGKARAGDLAMLSGAGQRHGFAVTSAESFCHDDLRISSTEIRTLLANSEFLLAERMLGRAFSMQGRVSYGQQLGRTIGFPTANIAIKRQVSPVSGVFVVKVEGDFSLCKTKANAKIRYGIANLGSRPTVNGRLPRLEVHLFELNCMLYGKRLTVTFLHKLRAEQKFNGLSALKTQINKDAVAARQWLLTHGF